MSKRSGPGNRFLLCAIMRVVLKGAHKIKQNNQSDIHSDLFGKLVDMVAKDSNSI